MGESAGAVIRHGTGYPGIDLGVEPAIALTGRLHAAQDRGSVSTRWLCGTILTGLAGAALIGAAIYTALDRESTFARQPDFAVVSRKAPDQQGTDLRKGDRLVKKVDIVAEKQSFRAPTTVNVGDKQVIRLRGYTHVATTLTMTPTDLADAVPAFNPLKLLAADQPNAPGAQPDLGPILDAAEVAFVTKDLNGADPSLFAGALSLAEAQAQVAQVAQGPRTAYLGDSVSLALPPQLLLMRTSRAGLANPAAALGYANGAATITSPFKSIEVHMVPENVTVLQRAETPHESGQEERLVVLRHGDSLEEILKGVGATREQVRAIFEAFGARRGDQPIAEGRRLKLLLANVNDAPRGRQIARLSVYLDEALETTVALNDAGQYVRVEPADAAGKAARVARDDTAPEDNGDTGGMRLYDSVYQTALRQQIPTPVIEDMIRVFSNDVDFQQSVQGGDSIDAFYANSDDGGGHPDLLFASLTARNDVYRYYRYQAPDDPGSAYYDDAGRSVRKFLIRNPVPTGIFTSPFGMRFHPVLGYTRPHTGVDWTAPVGTPILAAGNGTVLKAERSPSYGNHVEIQHANGYITTYSHMVGFARGIADGVKIRQGQVVGYLGQTGLATGPHLHYEVIVNGHFVDPMRVKLARTRELDGKQLADFKREHDRINALMATAPNAVLPSPPPDLQKRASN